jgi:endonuclease YncB( thermonuclease family)
MKRSHYIVVVVAVLSALALFVVISNSSTPQDVPRDKELQPPECRGTAACLEGAVTRIVDGDTLDVNNTRIRLALIDTPEIGEAGHLEARQKLASICQIGGHSLVDEDDLQTERSFGRLLGKVYCAGQRESANEILLESGNAIILREFCRTSEFSSEDWARKYGC